MNATVLQAINNNIESVNINLTKNMESINRNMESINRNMESINRNMESMNKNMESMNKSMESMNKNMTLMNRNMESMNRNITNELHQSRESMDKMRHETMMRISRFENQVTHIDKGVEITITNTVKEFLQNVATKNGMRFTFKMGRSFVKKIVDPQSSKLITDLDGCYILTNTPNNAKYVNTQKTTDRSNVLMKLESEYEKKKAEMQGATNANKKKLQAKMDKIMKAKDQLASDNIDGVVDQVLDEIITGLELEEADKNPLPSKRYICIVEAKTYMSKNEIEDQGTKMIDLIMYFKNAYLYHKLKPMTSRWSKNFIETNENFNLLFDGIILILGGTHYIESIVMAENDILQKTINAYIDGRKKELADMQMDPEARYELEFLNTLDCKTFVVVSGRVEPSL